MIAPMNRARRLLPLQSMAGLVVPAAKCPVGGAACPDNGARHEADG